MNDSALFAAHAEICKVFSNAMRLQILGILRDRELSVHQVARALRRPLGTVSPHLLMMKQRRVLTSRREGSSVFYRLANPRLLKAFDLIHDILLEQLRKDARRLL